MRIVQVIDSLEAGGAERLAVTLANTLSYEVEFSGLCVTREEGSFKDDLLPSVGYLFLGKKKSFDVKAALKLKKFIVDNNVDLLHAHSSSFFIATLTKLFCPRVKILWHDHFGNSEFLNERKHLPLKLCSLLFHSIIPVNSLLEDWAKDKLFCKNVQMMNNFVNTREKCTKKEVILNGDPDRRIVCLANLRPQKDHDNLLDAFEVLLKNNSDWTLHLLGKDFEDDYSKELRQRIRHSRVFKDSVFIYGSVDNVQSALKQSTIGVLSSKSEGLPISLLEYGYSKLPVVCTDVGECSKVVIDRDTGLLVPPSESLSLAGAFIEIVENEDFRESLAQNLHKRILADYTEKSNVEFLLKMYK